ncbi:hypothetical protein QVD17_01314 [Tagetes erecta]|uniref:Uncharacterized protein n=1 Tax=Tagetes erecta TaxID=13708 RepID=A0AAD8L9G2_TARER|nr:hypothetical protein QVD17_01314 [Tagetes erecta]
MSPFNKKKQPNSNSTHIIYLTLSAGSYLRFKLFHFRHRRDSPPVTTVCCRREIELFIYHTQLISPLAVLKITPAKQWELRKVENKKMLQMICHMFP